MVNSEEMWHCQMANCGYIYNPDKGDRKGKIPKLFFDSNFQIFEINSRNPLNLLHPNLIWVIPKLKGSAKDIKLYI